MSFVAWSIEPDTSIIQNITALLVGCGCLSSVVACHSLSYVKAKANNSLIVCDLSRKSIKKAKSEMTLKDKCAFIKTSTGHFHLVCSPSSLGQGSIRTDLMMGERPGQLSRF